MGWTKIQIPYGVVAQFLVVGIWVLGLEYLMRNIFKLKRISYVLVTKTKYGQIFEIKLYL